MKLSELLDTLNGIHGALKRSDFDPGNIEVQVLKVLGDGGYNSWVEVDYAELERPDETKPDACVIYIG